jgi:hypothetical protein
MGDKIKMANSSKKKNLVVSEHQSFAIATIQRNKEHDLTELFIQTYF